MALCGNNLIRQPPGFAGGYLLQKLAKDRTLRKSCGWRNSIRITLEGNGYRVCGEYAASWIGIDIPYVVLHHIFPLPIVTNVCYEHFW